MQIFLFLHTKNTFKNCKKNFFYTIEFVKLKISIPLATAIVLVLTLLINIIGLQMSLEKHFPDYIASINERFHKENNINPE